MQEHLFQMLAAGVLIFISGYLAGRYDCERTAMTPAEREEDAT